MEHIPLAYSLPKLLLYNDDLQKHEINGEMTSFFYYSLCIIFVYNLPGLHTINVNKFKKREGFHSKKKKQETNDIPQKL